MTSAMHRPVYPNEQRPWSLILALVVALTIGLIGLPLQFITYRQIGQASKAEQLREGQRALCEQLNDLALQVQLGTTDCTKINATEP